MSRVDLAYMIATVYGEARGEAYEGKLAVAHVILNRTKGKSWYGKTVKGVCIKPWQFSCWNMDDPNFPVVKAIKDSVLVDDNFQQDTVKECVKAAKAVLSGKAKDNTSGSKHYHTKQVSPAWSKGKEPVVIIGNHQFYNNIDN